MFFLPVTARRSFGQSVFVENATFRVIESIMFFKHYWELRRNQNDGLHRRGMFSNDISHLIRSVPGKNAPRKEWVVVVALMGSVETHEDGYGRSNLLSHGQSRLGLYLDCFSGPAHKTVKCKWYLPVLFRNDFLPAFGNVANLTIVSRRKTVTLRSVIFQSSLFFAVRVSVLQNNFTRYYF